jgi:hypothetical protein
MAKWYGVTATVQRDEETGDYRIIFKDEICLPPVSELVTTKPAIDDDGNSDQTIQRGTLGILGKFISNFGGRIATWAGSLWSVSGGGYIDLSNGGAGGTQIGHSTKSIFLTSNVGSGTGGDTKTLEVKGSDIIRETGAKAIFDNTGAVLLSYLLVTDASYAPGNSNFLLELPAITANRTITLPAGKQGQAAILWNRNTSAFLWLLAGTAAKDKFGNTVASLPGIGVYTLVYNGTFWLVQSQSEAITNEKLTTWTNSGSYSLTGITRDSNEAITTATIVWPDGSTGVFTSDTLSTDYPGAIDAYHVTYVPASGPTKTITQSLLTRDASGAVTAQPILTIA